METTDTRWPDSLTALHWVGILAALVSAGIHLLLGVRLVPSPLGVSFLLAAGGFVGGVGLVLAGRRRRTVYAVGVPFTAVQILLWYVFNFTDGSKSFPADIGALGAADKVTQAALIGVLLALLWRGDANRGA